MLEQQQQQHHLGVSGDAAQKSSHHMMLNKLASASSSRLSLPAQQNQLHSASSQNSNTINSNGVKATTTSATKRLFNFISSGKSSGGIGFGAGSIKAHSSGNASGKNAASAANQRASCLLGVESHSYSVQSQRRLSDYQPHRPVKVTCYTFIFISICLVLFVFFPPYFDFFLLNE